MQRNRRRKKPRGRRPRDERSDWAGGPATELKHAESELLIAAESPVWALHSPSSLPAANRTIARGQ